MATSRRFTSRFFIRLCAYPLIAILFFVYRGGEVSSFVSRLVPSAAADSTITFAGGELAPDLIPKLISSYLRDYPHVHSELRGGGTTHALEALLNREVDVAFLSRPPLSSEQALFRSTHGDTALWIPIAVGAVILARGPRADTQPISKVDLRHFIEGTTIAAFDRLYVPDPNSGLWHALLSRLELPPVDPEQWSSSPRVVFVKDETAVIEAVRADDRSLGLLSSFVALDPPGSPDVAADIAPVGAGVDAVEPTFTTIASGSYPFHHYLYVSCPTDSRGQGAMFVTHVTSGRGQRQVERSGWLPARQVSRDILLTKRAVGE